MSFFSFFFFFFLLVLLIFLHMKRTKGKTDRLDSVPTDVNVFPGLPHGFRRYGDKLSGSKKWDDVITDGIKWALDKPEPNAFKIKVP